MNKFNLRFGFNTRLFAMCFIFILLFVTSIITNNKFDIPQIRISHEYHAINPTSAIIYINGGLTRMISSLIWVKTLLDADLERNFNIDKGSWIYFRFNTISQLDPNFLLNYQYGGKYLSIIKDDLVNAEKIFLKGLKYFPEDYSLNYDLAFLYFNELKELDKAIPYLMKVRKSSKAPYFISALIATLMMKEKISSEQIVNFLKVAIAETNDEILLQLYRAKLEKIKSKK